MHTIKKNNRQKRRIALPTENKAASLKKRVAQMVAEHMNKKTDPSTDSPALRLPFIMTILGSTGSGKTYNFIELLKGIQSGRIRCVQRFTTPYGKEGDPVVFDKIYYFGMCSYDSLDEKHRRQVHDLVSCAAVPQNGPFDKRAWSFDEYKADQYRKMGFGGISPHDVEVLQPISNRQLLVNFMEEFKSQMNGNKWCWTLVVLDDFLSMVDNIKGDTHEIVKMFQIGSHHAGNSYAFLCQENPQKGLGQAIVKSSHYFLMPLYNGISNFDDLHTFFQKTDGRSADRVQELRQKLSGNKKYNYVLYNRKELKTDDELMS
jgi:hypothetical protein